MRALRKIGGIVWHVVFVLGCAALFLAIAAPGSFNKLPNWAAVPLVIGGVMFFFMYVGYKAYPLLRDVFGERREHTSKPADKPDTEH